VRRDPETNPVRLPRLDPYRRAQLEADLALTPTERVLAAERTAREAPRRRSGVVFLSFDSFEEYFEWKRREAFSDLSNSSQSDAEP